MILSGFCAPRSTAGAKEFPEKCPELTSATKVLSVGDLHFENFGTWRDKEGRLAWGINDFDEAFELSYTVRPGPPGHEHLVVTLPKRRCDHVCVGCLLRAAHWLHRPIERLPRHSGDRTSGCSRRETLNGCGESLLSR